MFLLTKERVFQIMGKYYGNAYYRSAIEQGISEDDLQLTTEILNKVNDLGYNFSNLHALTRTEDSRFVPIVLENFQKFKAANYRTGLIHSVCYPSYSGYVPQLLSIYEETTSPQTRIDISQCLLCIGSRRYVPEYLRIINRDDFGVAHDYLIDLLCKLRVKEVLPKLLELLKSNQHQWAWTFLRYAPVFRDPSLLPFIEPYLESDDGEFRSLARKATKKLTNAEYSLIEVSNSQKNLYQT